MTSTIQHQEPDQLHIEEEHGSEPRSHAPKPEEECRGTLGDTPTHVHYPP